MLQIRAYELGRGIWDHTSSLFHLCPKKIPVREHGVRKGRKLSCRATVVPLPGRLVTGDGERCARQGLGDQEFVACLRLLFFFLRFLKNVFI